jgi:hypothetical protein
MSRLLQVILALIGLAITGVLGLASERSESLQARHSLIGLFTETVSAARTTCDGGLARMAQGALDQLENLESQPRLFMTAQDRADRDDTQKLLADYQDYMVEVQGTIDAGNCGTAAVVAAPVIAAPAPRAADEAPAAARPAPAAPVQESVVQAPSNVELRQAEARMLPKVLSRSARDLSTSAREALGPASYYAILGSYAVGDRSTYDSSLGVLADWRRLQQATRGQNVTLQVLQSSRSNHFAIVLVPEGLERDGARELVAMARAQGWASDAYVQVAYGWAACANPEQITPTRDCR